MLTRWSSLAGRLLARARLKSVISILMLGLSATGCSGGGGGGGPADGGFVGAFTSDNLNLDITVNTIVIPSNLRPAVTFTVTDDAGELVPMSELTDLRFILAVLERTGVGIPFEYRSYTTEIEDPDGLPNSGDEATQAAYDPAALDGLSINEDGSFTYTFATAIPSDYDRTATHQLGGQFQREADGLTYRANITLAFRPDGASVTETREQVVTQSCNTCHTRVSEHGNIRREVQLCILCHTSQSTDAETGNSLHFAEMIHKIHKGANLPSFVQDGEPYQISGFMDRIFDYSTVEYPKDNRNCLSCHEGAPQSDVILHAPTAAGCQSCHDRVWYGPVDEVPSNFDLHPGGSQPDDAECSNCHSPDGNGQAPLNRFHIIPTQRDEAPGLALDITAVTMFPGAQETGLQITFTAEDGDGEPIADLAVLDTVAATVANPANEYETFVRETIAGSSRAAERGGGVTILATDFLTFDPADVTIDVGDTVTWITLQPTHNVAESDTPADNFWNGAGYTSGAPNDVDTFQFTFDTEGVFYFVCEPHALCCGMKGSVTVQVPEAIEVTSPNGGESWEAGTSHDITWTASAAGTVEIGLRKSAVDVRVLASGLDASLGLWTWDIPVDETPATDYTIRIVSELDAAVFDDSDADFAILDPSVIPPGGTLVNNGDGSYDYTFLARLLTGSTDSFAVAMEGRREFVYRGEVYDQGTSTNGQLLFTLDATPPTVRRTVVDEAKCTVCHEEVRNHGTLRRGIEYCVMCHNPNSTDEARRPVEELPPVSVNFKKLIHSIHRGEDLTQGFTVYGFGSTPHDYADLRYPADLRDCSMCHIDGTERLPLPPEALSTVVTQDDGNTFVSEVLPIRAACNSCHDSAETELHALEFTDELNGIESCADCHGDGEELSVTNAHLIEP